MQTIIVDMTPGFRMPTIYYSQGDVGTQFAIDLRSRFGDSFPTGTTVTIQATKPSGFGFSVAATSVTNGVATFTTTAEMTDEFGRFPAELKVTKTGLTLFTANFYMDGERNTHPEGTTDGSQETVIPELTQLVERVEDAASSVLDMTVVANTLPAGSDATYSYDEETNTATFGIPKGADGSLASGVLAPTYSSSSTYAVGDYVYYSGSLYRCTTAITTAEAWTSGHWTQVALAPEVSDLKSELNANEKDVASIEKNIAVYNKNRYNGFCFPNHRFNSNGNIQAEPNWNLTDYIYIGDLEDIFVSAEVIASGARLSYKPYFATVYDEKLNYIQYVGDQPDAHYTVPTGVSFIRFSYQASLWQNVQVESGSNRSDYVPFDYFAETKRLTDAESNISYLQTASLMDVKTPLFCSCTNKKFLEADGDIVDYSDASFVVTDYIDVSGYSELYINGSSVWGNGVCAFYNSSKAVVSVPVKAEAVGTRTFITTKVSVPQNAKYAVLAGLRGNMPYCFGITKNTAMPSALSGKKVTVIGDSITERNNTAAINWATYLENKTGCILQNLGVSGSGFYYSSPYKNRISQIANDTDIIGVAISFNDIGKGVSIGVYTDTEETTLCGYAYVCLSQLQAAFPTTPIIVYSQGPWSAYHYGGALGSGNDYIRELTKMCNQKFGIPVYDELYFNGSALRPWDADNQDKYYKNEITGELDITHPNSFGHRIIANYLIPKFEQNIGNIY